MTIHLADGGSIPPWHCSKCDKEISHFGGLWYDDYSIYCSQECFDVRLASDRKQEKARVYKEETDRIWGAGATGWPG